MARRKFEDGFKERAVAYCQEHPEKTMKACASDLDIGYSTLRRWVVQVEEAKAAEHEKQASDESKDLAMEEKAPAILAETDRTSEEGLTEVHEEIVNSDENIVPEEIEKEVEQSVEKDDDKKTDDAAVQTETATPTEQQESALTHSASEPTREEHDAIEDDPLFSSIGSSMGNRANVHPHDEDYDLRCKSHPSAYKNIQHMAGDVIVSVSAQIGNVVEDITGVAERIGLYKKRHDLKKERNLIRKEKQKRQKH